MLPISSCKLDPLNDCMNENTTSQIRDRVNDLYHQESRSIFATLIRLIGDFDLAEEAIHEAFAVAIKQ